VVTGERTTRDARELRTHLLGNENMFNLSDWIRARLIEIRTRQIVKNAGLKVKSVKATIEPTEGDGVARIIVDGKVLPTKEKE
jgi:hypothetical protein